MNPKTNRSLLRAIRVFAAMVALPIIALAPVYVASVTLTDQAVEIDEPIQQAATNDVTDIDRNGTVMYTVSPSRYTQAPKFETESPLAIMRGSDLIKVTVIDRGTERSSSPQDHQTDYECELNLHLTSSDRYAPKTKTYNKTNTYVGYLRIDDEDVSTFYLREPSSDRAICSFILTESE